MAVDNSLLRSGDPEIKISDPSKIFNEFGWKTKLSFEDLIERCIKNRLTPVFNVFGIIFSCTIEIIFLIFFIFIAYIVFII